MTMFSTRLTITNNFESGTPEAEMMLALIHEFYERLQHVGQTPTVECFINGERTYLEINGDVLEEL